MKREELISREALLVDINAALRFAELKGEALTVAVLKGVVAAIERQKTMGVVNKTEYLIYREEERE